jgi:hypothetical protein
MATCASAHGVVTMIKGANGVDMPGLSGNNCISWLRKSKDLVVVLTLKLYVVADGTPRDCSSNRCGSQADTAIIRDREISGGQCGPLGRTQGNGPIEAKTMVATFMGTTAAKRSFNETEAEKRDAWYRRQLNGLAGLLGGGGAAPAAAKEANVAAMAGAGASSGLPTCGDDGTIEMVFHQVQCPSSFYKILDSTNKSRFARSTKMELDLSKLQLMEHLAEPRLLRSSKHK